MPEIREIDIRQIEDQLVIYFGCAGRQINAYTLATTLVNIADAAKASNARVNPGYDIEIVVEALAGGSFKAKIRAVYKSAHNLFSKDPIKGIILGIVATLIYEHALAPNRDIKIEIHDDSVIIQQEGTKIIVPRNVYEATKEVRKDPQVRQSVASVFRALDDDKEITSIGVARDVTDPPPALQVDRSVFAEASKEAVGPEPKSRIIREQAELQILRAILERSRRQWQFSWRGIRISAPVTDGAFYDDFFAHRITIAPGDTLDVDLVILQIRDPDTGIYTNVEYSVEKVRGHKPRLTDQNLSGDGF